MNVWNKRLDLARRDLIKMANSKRAADCLVAQHARLFLKAYHKGPWRMIFAMVQHELDSLWGSYGWSKWQWFRVKVLKREPDPVWVIAQSIAEERGVEVDGKE